MDSRARSENTVRGEKKSRNNQLSSLLFSNRESELVSVKIDFSRISLADQSVRGIEAGKSMDDPSVGDKSATSSRNLATFVHFQYHHRWKKRTAMRVGITPFSLSHSRSRVCTFSKFAVKRCKTLALGKERKKERIEKVESSWTELLPVKSSRGNEIRRKKIGKIFESRESFPLFTLPLSLSNDRTPRIEKRNSGTAEKFKSMEEKKGGCWIASEYNFRRSERKRESGRLWNVFRRNRAWRGKSVSETGEGKKVDSWREIEETFFYSLCSCEKKKRKGEKRGKERGMAASDRESFRRIRNVY